MIQTSDFNPWEGIRSASSHAYFASRRVDESLNPQQRDLHWSLDEMGSPALLIGYDTNEQYINPMPRFKGIASGEDCGRHLMVIALKDPAMSEAFLKVCLDIIKVLQTAPVNQQRNATILRLERWAYFFQGKRLGLTEEEQKGLIAELLCFQRIALRSLTPKAALQSWTGPQQAVHDFSFGKTAIEVKSNRGAGTPTITINSATQLSVNDNERLFLYVVEVNQEPSRAEGHSLNDYVRQTRALLDSPLDALEFDLKLSQIGFEETDNYSGTAWSIGAIRQFIVPENFPHIDESSLDPAISSVTYKVNLNHCGTFEISEDALLKIVGGGNA